MKVQASKKLFPNQRFWLFYSAIGHGFMVNFVIQSASSLVIFVTESVNDKNLHSITNAKVLKIFNESLLILLDLTKAVNSIAD